MRQFSLFALLLLLCSQYSWAQCPNCTINLPQMPADTVYLDSIPNAMQNSYYEEVISFRLPYTTTPLVALDPTIPSGISLSGFQIVGVSGLPLGMSFLFDRPLPAVYDEDSPDTRDGCVTLCGTPLQADTFIVTISVLAETGILPPQPADIPLTFVVDPDTTAGFTLSPNMGCAPLEVTFSNNIQVDPNFNQAATYSWDFGNGQSSTDENPVAVTYADSGTYAITQEAIVSTAEYFTYLDGITITAASCDDAFGDPEIFLTVQGSQSGIDTITGGGATNVPSSQLPLAFSFGQDIPLVAGTRYTIDVDEDDSFSAQFPSIQDCGVVDFAADTTASIFSLTDGDLTLTVNLTHDTLITYDTITTTEYVVVQNCTSVEEVELILASFKVYPNPSQGLLNVAFEVPGQEQANSSLRLVDMLGRELMFLSLGQTAGAQTKSLDLSAYPAGIYNLQLQIGDRQVYRKIQLMD